MALAIDIPHIPDEVAGKNVTQSQRTELGRVLDTKGALQQKNQLGWWISLMQGQDATVESLEGAKGGQLDPLLLAEMREDPKTTEKLR